MCPCRALQEVVEKCGKAFEPHLTSDLAQLVFTCLSHTNCFVRETGYRVIVSIITISLVSVCVGCVCMYVHDDVELSILNTLIARCVSETYTHTKI